ncbi:MAG: MATE family multidrug resistance protein [Cryomorphaceae bacterium]
MTPFITEIRALIRLALPVSLAQLALVGMSATDVLVAGQAGTVELAGMNLGVNAWNMVILFFMGIGFATQPLVAKHFGAKDDAGVKHQLHQSIWMCLGVGVIATVLVLAVSWGLKFAPLETQMLSIAREYLLVISLCAIPMTMIPAVRGTLEGMSLTRVVLWINLAAFLLNIPLDLALVHGLYGFPKLGGVGCAWATVALVWVMFISTIVVLVLHKKLRDRNFLGRMQRPNWSTISKTLKMGVPIGFSIVIELSMFSGAGMMIAFFGPIEASAHAVAITVASLSFMLYVGIGQGVTIRASQFFGAESNDQARYTIKAGTVFNLMISALICVLFLLFNHQLIALFSSDPEVIALAVVLLYFGAVFQLADCLQVAAIFALRAYHDTASPPKYQFVAFWIFGLPIGIGLSFYNWFPGLAGAKGMWMAMVVSLFLVGVLLLWRLIRLMREPVNFSEAA